MTSAEDEETPRRDHDYDHVTQASDDIDETPRRHRARAQALRNPRTNTTRQRPSLAIGTRDGARQELATGRHKLDNAPAGMTTACDKQAWTNGAAWVGGELPQVCEHTPYRRRDHDVRHKNMRQAPPSALARWGVQAHGKRRHAPTTDTHAFETTLGESTQAPLRDETR
ncbi:hypothetical protein C8J57DRAFT_1233199 [Mycena rebaudengoi]|nr:hypothetical protein C8J57DRAFT_1233199 [Mycena rebaudengoi]